MSKLDFNINMEFSSAKEKAAFVSRLAGLYLSIIGDVSSEYFRVYRHAPPRDATQATALVKLIDALNEQDQDYYGNRELAKEV